jgi:hypothetical protein
MECEFCGAPERKFEDKNGNPYTRCIDDCQNIAEDMEED